MSFKNWYNSVKNVSTSENTKSENWFQNFIRRINWRLELTKVGNSRSRSGSTSREKRSRGPRWASKKSGTKLWPWLRRPKKVSTKWKSKLEMTLPLKPAAEPTIKIRRPSLHARFWLMKRQEATDSLPKNLKHNQALASGLTEAHESMIMISCSFNLASSKSPGKISS